MKLADFLAEKVFLEEAVDVVTEDLKRDRVT